MADIQGKQDSQMVNICGQVKILIFRFVKKWALRKQTRKQGKALLNSRGHRHNILDCIKSRLLKPVLLFLKKISDSTLLSRN